METIYTKEHCLEWVKNPQIDPVTHQSILDNKSQFKVLLDKCKANLSPADIKQYNIDMLAIIYPIVPEEKPDLIIPSNTTYHISKLGTEQHKLYTDVVYGHKISREEMLKRINDDHFITGILINERLLLTRKHDKYLELSDIYGSTIQFNKQLITINDRLTLLGNQMVFSQEVIDKKKTQLLSLLDSVMNLMCESRAFIHQIVYQKIIYFSTSADLSMVNLLIGKIGTGKAEINQLFANLYFVLGMINTNVVKKMLSPLNIECMICSDHFPSSDLLSFVGNFRQLCAINFVTNDVKSAQKFLQENGNIKYLFDDIIYLSDYSSSDLPIILFNIIKHIYLQAVKLVQQQPYIGLLITNNPDMFVNQAKDMKLLAHYIVNDFILLSSQKQDYGPTQINDTFKKFFLHKGKYVTIRENNMTSTPMYNLTHTMGEILVSNLLNRQQIDSLIQNDEFLGNLIKSKKKLLTDRLVKYESLCNLIAEDGCSQAVNIIQSHIVQFNANVTPENLKRSLNEILTIIDTIKGESRENIRRTLYSQICIFSQFHSYDCRNFMNYVIIGPKCSNKIIIFDAISKICEQVGFITHINGHTVTLDEPIPYEQILEHVQIFEGMSQDLDVGRENILKYIELHIGLCGIVMNSRDIQTTIPFNHLFTNYLMLLPYTSNDLSEIFSSRIGANKLSPTQIQYIKQLINLVNKDPDYLFDEQECDMINLAKHINYDVVLDRDQYGIQEIHHSFQKLFYAKGVLIDFSNGSQGALESIGQVFQDVKKLRSFYFNN